MSHIHPFYFLQLLGEFHDHCCYFFLGIWYRFIFYERHDSICLLVSWGCPWKNLIILPSSVSFVSWYLAPCDFLFTQFVHVHLLWFPAFLSQSSPIPSCSSILPNCWISARAVSFNSSMTPWWFRAHSLNLNISCFNFSPMREPVHPPYLHFLPSTWANLSKPLDFHPSVL